jgi:hypothetical protein
LSRKHTSCGQEVHTDSVGSKLPFPPSKNSYARTKGKDFCSRISVYRRSSRSAHTAIAAQRMPARSRRSASQPQVLRRCNASYDSCRLSCLRGTHLPSSRSELRKGAGVYVRAPMAVHLHKCLLLLLQVSVMNATCGADCTHSSHNAQTCCGVLLSELAHVRGLRLNIVNASTENDLGRTFANLGEQRADALIIGAMIHASIGPCRSISGTTISRTLPRTFSSDQPPWLTKCNID